MRIGSLFSGYGGLDMGAAHALGGTTAWVSDIDPGACRILAHRYPHVPNLGDIAIVNWDEIEPVDILTGGFPCQDVSCAGGRAGLGPGTRSGLWSRMAEAIDRLRPSLVIAENVRGLLSAEAASDVEPCPWCLGDGAGEPPLRALGAVLADLAELGYDASWHGLRAADVGAPHGRFRVFVLAFPAADADASTCRARQPGRGEAGRVVASDRAVGHRPDTSDLGGGAGTARIPWGGYGPAIRRWERRLGRPAPAPTEPGRTGPVLAPAFAEWMMGLPAGWVTQVPGLSRSEQLKALGNGVVPQQAAAAVRFMLARRSAERWAA